MEQPPSIGRQVHYVDGEGVTRPATITHVYDPPEACIVDLTYLTRTGTTVNPRRMVHRNDATGAQETWTWPPRVGA